MEDVIKDLETIIHDLYRDCKYELPSLTTKDLIKILKTDVKKLKTAQAKQKQTKEWIVTFNTVLINAKDAENSEDAYQKAKSMIANGEIKAEIKQPKLK